MPIRLVIENDRSFSPEDAKVMIEAFEDALRTLNLSNRADPLTLMVAKRIVELAKEGERDPKRLCERTLATITN